MSALLGLGLLAQCECGGFGDPPQHLFDVDEPEPFVVRGTQTITARVAVNYYYEKGRVTFEIQPREVLDGQYRIVAVSRRGTPSSDFTGTLDSEVTDTVAWWEIEPRSTQHDDAGDRILVDLQVECLEAGPGSLEVRLEGIRGNGEVDERDKETIALQCDPAGGTTGSGTGMTATTTVTPDTDSDTGTTTEGGTGNDTGTTGGGASVELEPGTYQGATSAEQLIIFDALGNGWFAALAASGFGVFVDLTTDTIVEEVGVSESAAMGDAAGTEAKAPIPTVFFGFPGLRYAMYDGNAFDPLAPIDGFLPAARLAMAPSSTGAAAQVCGVSDQGLISCVNATGTDWAEDSTTATDMAWRADCVGFSAEGLAVDEGWAMLLFGTGTICHGQLGPGNVATALPLFANDVEDLECPSDSVGTSPICAVLERAGTVSIVGWQMPSATPVVIDSIATCDDSTELAGLVSADDATVSFATACAGSDESHLITVDAGTGALVSHMVHGLPGCSGRVAALPTEDRVGVACSGTIEILDTADFTPM